MKFPNIDDKIFAVRFEHDNRQLIFEQQKQDTILWIRNSWPDTSLLPLGYTDPPEFVPCSFDDMREKEYEIQTFQIQIPRTGIEYEKYRLHMQRLERERITLEQSILSDPLLNKSVALTPNIFPADLPDDTSHLVAWAISEKHMPELIDEIALHFTVLGIKKDDCVIFQNPEFRKSIQLFHVHLFTRIPESIATPYFESQKNPNY